MTYTLPPAERLGLSRKEVAEYIGVSPSLLDVMIVDGRMPRPKWINARRVWDRRAVERAFRALPEGNDASACPAPIDFDDDIWNHVAV